MRTKCTDLLLKYRDMARMIWNSAFWTNVDLREGDLFVVGEYTGAFDEAMARLYEGMVLLPLGHTCRVQDMNCPGKAIPLSIEVASPTVEYLIDEDIPEGPSHRFTVGELPLQEGTYDFEFVEFFDWDQLGHRDFRFMKVLIRRMDANPTAVGYHALVPASECSAWALKKTL